MRDRNILKGKEGITLIELIVALALLSVFALGTTRILSVAIRTHHQMEGMDYALQVADTLMEKITGEIAGARADGGIVICSGAQDDTESGAAGNSAIEFYDDHGRHVRISVQPFEGANLLNIHYYGQEGGQDALDWTYDRKMYMGYEIESLRFSIPNPERRNVIRVELTLHSDLYGSQSVSDMVECYNFTEGDFDGIVLAA